MSFEGENIMYYSLKPFQCTYTHTYTSSTLTFPIVSQNIIYLILYLEKNLTPYNGLKKAYIKLVPARLSIFFLLCFPCSLYSRYSHIFPVLIYSVTHSFNRYLLSTIFQVLVKQHGIKLMKYCLNVSYILLREDR